MRLFSTGQTQYEPGDAYRAILNMPTSQWPQALQMLETRDYHERVIAGEACLQLAALIPGEADNLIDRAKKDWEKAITQIEFRESGPNRWWLHAQIGHAASEQYRALLVHGKLPAHDVNLAAYHDLLDIGEQARQEHEKYTMGADFGFKAREAAADLSGAVAELSLASLLAREGMLTSNDHEPTTWAVVPSLMADDNAKAIDPNAHPSDIHVYTLHSDMPHLAYRAQVKASVNGSPREVDPTGKVTYVYIAEDLALHEEIVRGNKKGDRRAIKASTILLECLRERERVDPACSERLDRRATQAVDVLEG